MLKDGSWSCTKITFSKFYRVFSLKSMKTWTNWAEQTKQSGFLGSLLLAIIFCFKVFYTYSSFFSCLVKIFIISVIWIPATIEFVEEIAGIMLPAMLLMLNSVCKSMLNMAALKLANPVMNFIMMGSSFSNSRDLSLGSSSIDLQQILRYSSRGWVCWRNWRDFWSLKFFNSSAWVSKFFIFSYTSVLMLLIWLSKKHEAKSFFGSISSCYISSSRLSELSAVNRTSNKYFAQMMQCSGFSGFILIVHAG